MEVSVLVADGEKQKSNSCCAEHGGKMIEKLFQCPNPELIKKWGSSYTLRLIMGIVSSSWPLEFETNFARALNSK